jgi:hypothetical protein
MATQLELRKGTRAQHSTFNGAEAEITVITDAGTETAVVHTSGGAGTGVELARNDKVVHTSGNETVAGIKTFSSSPIVPTPTTDMQSSTKKYVDDALVGTRIANTPAGSIAATTIQAAINELDTEKASVAYVDAVKTKTDKMNVSAITSMVVNADGTITITV